MNYGMLFNKNDYLILELLILGECTSAFKSLSTQAIIKDSKFSHVKVRQVIKSFLLSNFIMEGAKEGNNKTYYVTPEGIEHFKKVFNYTDEYINDAIYDYRCEKEMD